MILVRCWWLTYVSPCDGRYCFPFGRPEGALKATLSLLERVCILAPDMLLFIAYCLLLLQTVISVTHMILTFTSHLFISKKYLTTAYNYSNLFLKQ